MEELIYFLIDHEAFPPGWTNEQRLNAHNAVHKGIGKQSSLVHQEITVARLNAPPIYDEDSVLTSMGTKVIYRGVFTPEELTKEFVSVLIAESLNVNPTAVSNKIEFRVFTNLAEVHAFLKENATEWGNALDESV